MTNVPIMLVGSANRCPCCGASVNPHQEKCEFCGNWFACKGSDNLIEKINMANLDDTIQRFIGVGK